MHVAALGLAPHTGFRLPSTSVKITFLFPIYNIRLSVAADRVTDLHQPPDTSTYLAVRQWVAVPCSRTPGVRRFANSQIQSVIENFKE